MFLSCGISSFLEIAFHFIYKPSSLKTSSSSRGDWRGPYTALPRANLALEARVSQYRDGKLSLLDCRGIYALGTTEKTGVGLEESHVPVSGLTGFLTVESEPFGSCSVTCPMGRM